MAMDSLQGLLEDEIKDLYSAENQIIRALPRISKAVQNEELRQALEQHLEVTRGQVQRLEQAAQQLGIKPRGKKCVGMEGLLAEGNELLAERRDADPDVLDAGIIGAAQKVEHYEIAAYGTARTHAQQLGNRQVAQLLQQTLDEESQANEQLTQIAESMVNVQAAKGEGG